MKRTAISGVHGRQVLDSRGRPTVEVDVVLEDGSLGRAAVPSGASTGTAEAHELRDADPAVYEGRGVLLAVAHVNEEIATRVRGRDALEQRALDGFLRELDGTPSLRRLGANALLGVSLAACRAAAASTGQPLYARIADLSNTRALTMPLPMVNILSGGLHAGRGMDVQDFLAVPLRASSIEEAIRIVGRVRTAAAEVLARRGLPVLLADEGGLSPGCRTAEEALALVNESVVEARLEPGVDIGIAIDVAATSLQLRDGRYRFAREGLERDASEVIRLVDAWTKEYPVVSIEDALGEEDWKHWQALTRRLGASIQLVGDDLFTTHIDRVSRGVKEQAANGVLVKINQNGTLTGTLDVIACAKANGYAPVVSARSGETEDSFISDLAVGTAAGQIKIGSLRCSDRLAKYNQLLRIEEESRAPFAGRAALAPLRPNAAPRASS